MKKKGSITILGAIFIGIGSMVGAGIFSLLGQAGALAGSAVWISFLLGGLIALLTGYSIGKFAARYPSRGGIVEYLVQGYGVGITSGGTSLFYYIATLVTMAMVASSFGKYSAALFFPDGNPVIAKLLSSILVLALLSVNLLGPRIMSRVESAIVIFKIVILLIFAVSILTLVDPEKLSSEDWPRSSSILGSISLTFFAYAGFGVIANTSEDMNHPERDIPRAITYSIVLCMILYVVISIGVFGTMSPLDVKTKADTVLAYAAQPLFGNVGYKIMAFSAMAATASGVNSYLYGATNITYSLAKDGELPETFDRSHWERPNGLWISVVLVLLLINIFPLNTITFLGSAAHLLVYSALNFAHLKLLHETKANKSLVLGGFVGCIVALIFWAWFSIKASPESVVVTGGFVLASFLIEIFMQKIRGRNILPKTNQKIAHLQK